MFRPGDHVRTVRYDVGAIVLRVFDDGDLLIQIDPDRPHDPEAEKDLPAEVQEALAESRAFRASWSAVMDMQEPMRVRPEHVVPDEIPQ